MKRSSAVLPVLVAVIVFAACMALAQGTLAEDATAPDVPMQLHDLPGSSPPDWPVLMLLLGILLWSLAVLPLGMVSIVQSARLRTRQIPLATKLLACGIPWLLVLGGMTALRVMAPACRHMASDTAYHRVVLALTISHSLWCVVLALTSCLPYLFFITISAIIIHFKRKKMMANV